ncbi:MAG: HD domain-containing protein [Proteobacteria bacterium]|nr:HD domain-containing protein [Pseudomonadota bacterium]
MNDDDLKQLKRWFADYVAGFYTDDSAYNIPIRLKEEHTKRVCQSIFLLGKALGLSNQDMILAETVALFHDIGRFRQYAVYGTFNDRASENHARLGLRQMAKHRVLSACAKTERRLISTAIAFHNAAEIPKNHDEKTRFFMRLIRDADKLDIWKVFIDYYHEREKLPGTLIETGLPDDPACSPQVIQALCECRYVRMQDVRTVNDVKLLQISWVFDLNFAPAFQEVLRREFIEQIAATLPGTKAVAKAVQQARNYVQSRITYAKGEN